MCLLKVFHPETRILYRLSKRSNLLKMRDLLQPANAPVGRDPVQLLWVGHRKCVRPAVDHGADEHSLWSMGKIGGDRNRSANDMARDR